MRGFGVPYSTPDYKGPAQGNVVCRCSHHKKRHWNTKANGSAGPCLECDCAKFEREAVCVCRHGIGRHRGKDMKCANKSIDGCKQFQEAGNDSTV